MSEQTGVKSVDRSSPKFIAANLFLVLLVGLLSYFGGAGIVRALSDLEKDRSAAAWSVAPGKVTSFLRIPSGPPSRSHSGALGDVYLVTYEFEVAGRRYFGSDLTTLGNEVFMKSRYSRLTQGGSVRVLHDPGDPDRCALFRAEKEIIALRVAGYGGIVFVGFVLLCLIIMNLLRSGNQRPGTAG